MSVVKPILELMYKCNWHGPARWMTGRNLSKYDISKYLDWTVITQEWHRIQRHTGGLYCEARFGAYWCKSRSTLWVFSVTRVCYDSLLTGELCFSTKSMAQPGVKCSTSLEMELHDQLRQPTTIATGLQHWLLILSEGLWDNVQSSGKTTGTNMLTLEKPTTTKSGGRRRGERTW